MVDEEENEEEKKKKKKKGGSDEGKVGQSEVVVSEAFYEKMGMLGASSSLVAQILKDWRHLKGESLMSRLKSFFAEKLRASSHTEVNIEKGKDFGLVHNFIQHIKNLGHDLKNEKNLDQDSRHNPRQGPGSGPTPGM